MVELTGKTAIAVKSIAAYHLVKQAEDLILPHIVYGSVLVSVGILAGVFYELAGRPFDVVSRAVYLPHILHLSLRQVLDRY